MQLFPQPSMDSMESESPGLLDVYGIEEENSLFTTSHSDGLLRSGAKVLVKGDNVGKRQVFELNRLQAMQVVDPSLLGKTVLQRLEPRHLAALNPHRADQILPLKRPVLSNLKRTALIVTDTNEDGA